MTAIGKWTRPSVVGLQENTKNAAGRSTRHTSYTNERAPLLDEADSTFCKPSMKEGGGNGVNDAAQVR